MAKNRQFYAPTQNATPAPTEENEVLKGIEDDVFEGPVSGELIERPTYPSYVLGSEFIGSAVKLPHAAFKAAVAKYYPTQCTIIAYKETDNGTIVVLDAGLQGRRKEIV